ncbi:MAG: OmpA family protein [Shimia sp.]
MTAQACGDGVDCAPGGVRQGDPSSLSPAALRNHIFFVDGGATLGTQARRQVMQLALTLKTPPFEGTCLRLTGHADSGGEADMNLALGQERAEEVARHLLSQMPLGSMWIETYSAGEAEPMMTHAPSDPLQRRVEIEARRCLG